MITPKQLYTPTGKRIVGTAESMLTMHGIDCFGRNVDGSLVFDYNDKSKDYHDTEEQRRDVRGERLFQAEDGTDWPESSLSLEGEPLKPMPKAPTPDEWAEYLPLKVMPCPQHAGKHACHDQRWIATAGATVEHGHDPRPDQWFVTGGSLIAQMRDVKPGFARYMVDATNQHAEFVAFVSEILAAFEEHEDGDLNDIPASFVIEKARALLKRGEHQP